MLRDIKPLRKLELLAPAKNLECGIAAIDHGADAVYIGAPRFGARAAAGNSLDDIRQLCDYAHRFGAKVHVTVNTIIYDEELEDTLRMIAQLDEIGVDALLLQDMGVLWEVRANHLWHCELHSSTQCDARTADKVNWLYSLGFKRVVLARELSLDEIRNIHAQSPAELEVFVHGALCVSYSGVCYASEKCFGRSANRGECAQFCRMKFNLLDSEGREIEHERHLLSLKDLCQIDHLLDLAEAGATSFKIEGRLKDVNYVKNVVAAYSQKLDEIVAAHPDEYCRASFGVACHTFSPNLKKTFNRGYTHYFLNGRQPDIASFDTPKAMGEYVGKVKEIRGNISFNVATVASFSNGDGLCFINDQKELEGFRVNRVEGNRLYPHHMPEHLRPGMALYRNNDQAFEAVLAKKTATRNIPIFVVMREPSPDDSLENDASGVVIVVGAKLGVPKIEDCTPTGFHSSQKTYKVASFFYEVPLQLAQRPQAENMKRQLSKLGNTLYSCENVEVGEVEKYFIPNSVLSDIRRVMIEQIDEGIRRYLDAPLESGCLDEMMDPAYSLGQVGEEVLDAEQLEWQPEYAKWKYLYNVSNFSAVDFYKAHGMEQVSQAFELGDTPPLEWSSTSKETYEQAVQKDRQHMQQLKAQGANKKVVTNARGESLIMQCRHCLRYSLGYCVKRGGKRPTWKEPLFLELGDGRRFRLEFCCAECQMNIYSE